MISLAGLLTPETLDLDLPEFSKSEAIHRIASHLKSDPRVSNWSGLADALLERERGSSTYLGHGLAVPHARTNCVKSMVLALGRSKAGIPYPGGEKAHFIAVIGVPAAMATDYLRVAGSLARLFDHPATRTQLLAANSTNDFLQIAKERLVSINM